MPAIDTIAAANLDVGETFGAGTMAAGDSAAVRNFPPSAEARLLAAFTDHVTSVQLARVRSPLLHDNVRGIEFIPGEDPGLLPLYRLPAQKLFAQDELVFELSTAAATGKAEIVLPIYYSQLPGAAARLFMPGDVMPLIKNIKPVLVTIASGANVANTWLDTALTDDEDLLHANTDYAVLGITTDLGVAALAIKGIDTGNLRVGCPGLVRYDLTADWFVKLSEATGLPTIPVINAANYGATYLSLISSAATAAALNASVILAELSQNLG
jgi:hypothetical protein